MKRKIVSLSIFISFSILSLTGVLMYIQPFSSNVVTMHIIMGFFFIFAALFHILNNYTSLFKYLRTSSRFKYMPSRYLILLSLVLLMSWAVIGFGLGPFPLVSKISSDLKGDTEIFYMKVKTNAAFGGRALSVEVMHDAPSHTPTVAIWAEDKDGNYLYDLYVSEKMAKESFYNSEGKTKRPEALPVWSHKRGVQTPDGLYVPEKESPLTDGISGATPKTNYVVSTRLKPASPDSIRIFMEVNQSYDWNKVYHEKAFPTDTVYSGPGKVGQPALVYATKLFSLSEGDVYKMKLIGRAHHSGQDGVIYNDLKGITTALKIVKRVLVEVD